MVPATLYTSSVRTAFGFGRRTSSKIIPFTLAVFAFIPAFIQVGIGAITSGLDADIEFFEHEDYFGYVQIVLVLFCRRRGAGAVGRDQRTGCSRSTSPAPSLGSTTRWRGSPP